jgi:hypothetical protein
MTVARWSHLRVLGIQKAGFDLEMARQPRPASPAQRAAAAFKNLADNSRVLDLLHRYEVSFDRQFTRALNALLKLRATKSNFPIEPTAVAQALVPAVSTLVSRSAESTTYAPPAKPGDVEPPPAPAESSFPTEPNKINPPITPPASPAQLASGLAHSR